MRGHGGTWIAAVAVALALAAPAPAQAQTGEIDGKPLHVSVTDTGAVQLRLDGEAVFFNDLSAGLAIVGGGQASYPGDGTRQVVAAPTPGDEGTLHGMFTAGQGLEVAQDVAYEQGDHQVLLSYTFRNRSPEPISFRAVEFGDVGTGSDAGTGAFRPGNLRFIGARAAGGRLAGLEEQPGFRWTAYEEGEYNAVRRRESSGLKDGYVTGAVENEVAAEWAVDALEPGESRTIRVAWRVAGPASVTATVHADRDNGTCAPGDCSLREALTHTAPGTLVNLEAGDYPVEAALVTAQDVTLRGAGRDATRIVGHAGARVLDVQGGSLDLAGVRVTGGDTTTVTDGSGGGGGIRVRYGASLALADGSVSGNAAAGYGGGIFVEGTAALLRAALVGNRAVEPGGGGGLYAGYGALVSLINTTVSANMAQDSGGGLMLASTASLVNSTVAYNSAQSGGGLDQVVTTFPGPSADVAVGVRNSIVAANQGGDCALASTDYLASDHSLSSDESCSFDGTGDRINADAKLVSLANDVHALEPGSPAIRAGDPAACPATDQLGTERRAGKPCDIGAFQTGQTVSPPVIDKPADGEVVHDHSIVVAGTAPAGATVTIYDGDDQIGTRSASGGSWSTEIPVGREGEHVLTAVATLDGDDSERSQPRTFLVDFPPARPVVTFPDDDSVSGPNVRVRGTAQPGATVTAYESDDPAVLATATVDDAGGWVLVIGGAGLGSHNYFFTASDAGGESDRFGTSRTVTVEASADTEPPETTIDGGPDGLSGPSASFSFSASEPAWTFECKLDARAFAACTSPKAYDGLADGEHTFSVRATDMAGNVDASPATRAFTVDTTPPDAPVVTAPQDPGSAFTLTGTAEPGSQVTVLEGSTPVGTAVAGGDRIWTLALSGVSPGPHEYRAIATDAAGNRSAGSAPLSVRVSAPTVEATPTPTPSPTPTPTPGPQLPPPVVGKTVNVEVESGKVLVRLPGTNRYVLLSADRQLPVGTLVDATAGKVRLTAASDGKGATQSALFYGGIFKIGQTTGAKPVTELTLAGAKPSCKASKSASAAAKKPKTRKLWGDGSGSFRTRGQYSAATVRGTNWLTEDRCDGTFTRVVRGVVSVRDLVKRKDVIVRAGKTYLARPKKHG